MATKNYAAKVSIGGTIESSFNRAFGGAKNAVKGLGNEMKQLAKEKSVITNFRKATESVSKFEGELQKAKAKLDAAKSALASAAAPTATLTRAVDQAQHRVGALNGKLKSESDRLSTLKQRLDAAKISTTNLDAAEAKLEKRMKRISFVTGRHDKAQANFADAKGKLAGWAGAGLAVGATAAAMFGPSISASNEFSDSMVDVGKYVDGANTAEGLKKISDQIREIGRNSPIGAKGVAELVVGAGKLGMSAPEALEFGKAMETMAAGLDMLPDEAATILTKIKSSMRQTVPQALKLGDAMNYLGDITASDGKNIADIMSRVGSTVKSDSNGSLKDEEIAAVAAQFDIAAPNAEAGATAMKNFTKALSKGKAATKGNEWAYKQLGLDPVTIAAQMTKDAKGAIAIVLKKLGQVKPEDRSGIMAKLFGEESKSVIQNVIAAQDDLRKSLEAVANESNFVGRSAQEQARNNEKWSVQTGKLKSQFFDLGISIGDVVKEALGPLLMKVNPLMEKFAKWRKENPKLFKGIVMGAAALVGLAGAVVGVGLAMAGLKVAFVGLSLIGAKISAVFAGPVLSSIGLPVAALTAAALAIRKYWEPIKAFFHGVWMGVKEGWEGAGGNKLWETISSAFNTAAGAVKEFFKPVSLTLEEFLKIENTGKSVGKVIGETLVNALNFLITKGTELCAFLGGAFNQALEMAKNPGETFRALVHSIGFTFGEAWGHVKNLAEYIRDQFFEFCRHPIESVSKLAKTIGDAFRDAFNVVLTSAKEAFNWIDDKIGGIGKTMKSLTDGLWNSGAGTWKGIKKEFGAGFKEGSESVSPPKAPQPKDGAPQSYNFQIHTQPGQSPEAISEMVLRRLQQQQDQRNRGSLWDGGDLQFS